MPTHDWPVSWRHPTPSFVIKVPGEQFTAQHIWTEFQAIVAREKA